MKLIYIFLFISFLSYGQTDEIVLSSIDYPKQKDIYPEGYWKVWVNDLPRTENVIKAPQTSRRVREMEYFNRFLLYAKMQTNQPEELLLAFNDSYNYAPHYTVSRYLEVIPLNGKEYGYMWKMYKAEKKTIDSVCNSLNEAYDKDLIKLLKIIGEKDQRYRKMLSSSSLDELKENGSWKKQLQLDDENAKAITSILKDIGYPGRSVVGYDHEDKAFLAIQHSNLELMEYALPLVKNPVDQLDITAQYYAYLYDRIQLIKKLPQLYGTQSNLDGSLYQISDPENVNARRKKFGLFPIKV